MTIVLFLALFVLLTGFFAGMETGLISINRLRLIHKARNGSKNAQIAYNFLRQPDRILATTLVGCNLMSVIVSTLTTATMQEFFGPQGVPFAAAVSTIALLICGEFLPKAWFSSRPLERCVPLTRPLRFFEILFTPISKLIILLTSWAHKNNNKGGEVFVSRESLEWLLNDSAKGGQISPLERALASRILSLQLKTSAEMMTPLSNLCTLTENDTLATVAHLVKTTHHSKFPVLSNDKTTCLGVVHLRDIIGHLSEIQNGQALKYARKPFFVDAATRSDDVLPTLRRNNQHLAIVQQNNQILGIITVSGLLKQIANNLPSEA